MYSFISPLAGSSKKTKPYHGVGEIIDNTFWCRVARRGSDFWDWIDRRQIDAHCYSLLILWGTVKLTTWCMEYASFHPDKPGLEVAAIIAAVMGPWSALQAAAIKFMFDARATSFSPDR